MNCLMFKAVYVYMYIYKSEYKCLWSKKLMLNIFLAYIQLLIMNTSFFFPWHVFHIVKYVSLNGVSVAVN